MEPLESQSGVGSGSRLCHTLRPNVAASLRYGSSSSRLRGAEPRDGTLKWSSGAVWERRTDDVETPLLEAPAYLENVRTATSVVVSKF